MNGIYAIIVFLCVQEFTNASYYRIPKRYFKPQQENKQTKNAVNNPARNLPVFLPMTEQPTHIPEVSTFFDTEEKNGNLVLSNEVPILKSYQPLLKYELPKMTTLPILSLLPIVASLPVVNVAPKLREKLPVTSPATLPEVKILDVKSYPVNDEFKDDDDESEEEIEESVTLNISQEVKYEIFKCAPKKSPILHKVHRVEEFKRNILLDRREDPKNRLGEREGSMDLKEYMQRIAVRAELQRN